MKSTLTPSLKLTLNKILEKCFQKSADRSAFVPLDEILAFLQFYEFSLSTFSSGDHETIFTHCTKELGFCIGPGSVVGCYGIERQAWATEQVIGKKARTEAEATVETVQQQEHIQTLFQKYYIITRNPSDNVAVSDLFKMFKDYTYTRKNVVDVAEKVLFLPKKRVQPYIGKRNPSSGKRARLDYGAFLGIRYIKEPLDIILKKIIRECFQKSKDRGAFVSFEEILAFLQFYKFKVAEFSIDDHRCIFRHLKKRRGFCIGPDGVVGCYGIERRGWVGQYDIGKAPYNETNVAAETLPLRDQIVTIFKKTFHITRNPKHILTFDNVWYVLTKVGGLDSSLYRETVFFIIEEEFCLRRIMVQNRTDYENYGVIHNTSRRKGKRFPAFFGIDTPHLL